LPPIRACIVWRNPKYADQIERPRASEETGVRVGTWPRGKDSELRLSIDEFKGNRYLALRVWTRGGDGLFWPTSKGTSIRLSEAEDVADAIAAAVHQARQEGGGADRNRHQSRPPVRAQQRPQGRPAAPGVRASTPPWQTEERPSSAVSREFDQFGG
jgi:hypothetical protein